MTKLAEVFMKSPVVFKENHEETESFLGRFLAGGQAASLAA